MSVDPHLARKSHVELSLRVFRFEIIICILFAGVMNDGWESDGESHIQHTPVYSQTFSRGGSRRGGGTGCDYGNWQGGGRNNYRSNNPAEEKENEQGSGRFDHNRGRHRGGGSWRENSSGGPSGYGGGSGDGTKVMIKSSDVGKVIGKGGSKIRELQGESGAHIQVHAVYAIKLNYFMFLKAVTKHFSSSFRSR